MPSDDNIQSLSLRARLDAAVHLHGVPEFTNAEKVRLTELIFSTDFTQIDRLATLLSKLDGAASSPPLPKRPLTMAAADASALKAYAARLQEEHRAVVAEEVDGGDLAVEHVLDVGGALGDGVAGAELDETGDVAVVAQQRGADDQ